MRLAEPIPKCCRRRRVKLVDEKAGPPRVWVVECSCCGQQTHLLVVD